VPANGAALIKKAEVGAELTCRAHEKEFAERGGLVRRGVISYYAGATLANANDLHSWLQLIEQMSQTDVARGIITPFYQPVLQLTGDTSLALLGKLQVR
jgi:hypothetical protein